uniref:Uncharacterized protein n=1 Tax=Rhizophora mucronata TaxID=61149 RepID=A0A2P2N8K0_RHIMU
MEHFDMAIAVYCPGLPIQKISSRYFAS